MSHSILNCTPPLTRESHYSTEMSVNLWIVVIFSILLPYPRYLFLETFANTWWLGNRTEQESLVTKYGCNVTQRESMIHSMLAIAAGRNIYMHNVQNSVPLEIPSEASP